MRIFRWIAGRFAPKPAAVPGGPYTLALAAHVELKAGQFDRARAPLLEALASRDKIEDPSLVTYIISLLESTWLFADRYDEAVTFFSSYIAKYPREAEAYRCRGAAHWYAGRLQEALPDYNRSFDLKPDDFVTCSGRGQILAEVGESQRALEDLERALQILDSRYPLDRVDTAWLRWRSEMEAFIRNGRAFALSGIGDVSGAMSEFDRSIALCPENAWVYHNRAQVFERIPDVKQACADYQRSLAKQGPSLSLARREHAHARLLELSGRVD